MTRNELHTFVSESKGNENNICQIYAIKNGITVGVSRKKWAFRYSKIEKCGIMII